MEKGGILTPCLLQYASISFFRFVLLLILKKISAPSYIRLDTSSKAEVQKFKLKKISLLKSEKWKNQISQNFRKSVKLAFKGVLPGF